MKIKGLWGKSDRKCCGSVVSVRNILYILRKHDRQRTGRMRCGDSCAAKLHWINGRSCEKCGKALADTYRGRVCYDCMAEEHDFTRDSAV